jgi:parvulin-like peptidyl-prolyl isomerase
LGIGIGKKGSSTVVLNSATIENGSAVFNIVTVDSNSGSVMGTASLNPAGLATIDEEKGIVRKGFNNSDFPYDILFDENNERILVMDPALTDSVFTNLYFLEGKYSKYFQLFHKERGIYVYNVKWDGTANNSASKLEVVTGEEEVKASHILISTDNRTDAEALELIKEIQKNVTVDNFAEMAKQYSDCPSASKGGDLGWFGKGQMVAEFEKAAFDLDVGEISEPVKTQFGYHLILVEDKR